MQWKTGNYTNWKYTVETYTLLWAQEENKPTVFPPPAGGPKGTDNTAPWPLTDSLGAEQKAHAWL